MDQSRVESSSLGAGWRARLELEFGARGGRSVLVGRRHEGPLLVQRAFHPEGAGVAHGYLLHPPGGVVGGDSLELDVRVQGGAHCLLTTPGATKLYRTRRGEPSWTTQRLTVEAGATLEWLPQETIVFSGAEHRGRLEVNLEGGAASARFVGWEIVVAGRPGSGEPFTRGDFESRVELRLDGRPLLLERLAWSGSGGLLSAPFGLRGAPVVGSWVATGLGLGEAHLRELCEVALARAESSLPARSEEWRGLSALSHPARGEASPPGLLSGRYVGASAERAKAWMIELWRSLRPALLGREACPPRIWAT